MDKKFNKEVVDFLRKNRSKMQDMLYQDGDKGVCRKIQSSKILETKKSSRMASQTSTVTSSTSESSEIQEIESKSSYPIEYIVKEEVTRARALLGPLPDEPILSALDKIVYFVSVISGSNTNLIECQEIFAKNTSDSIK